MDKVDVYRWQNLALISQNRLKEAVENGLEFLELIGEKLPRKMSPAEVKKSVAEIRSQIAGRTMEDLINLPLMTDRKTLAIYKILPSLTVAEHLIHAELWPPLVLKRIHLVLKHGITPDTPICYTSYGAMLCVLAEEIEPGYQFGAWGLRLAEKIDAERIKCRTICQFNINIRFFKDHVKETIEPLLECYRLGLESGDLFWAGVGVVYHCVYAFFAGKNLAWVNKEIAVYKRAVEKINQQMTLVLLGICQRVVFSLSGESEDPRPLSAVFSDERNRFHDHQLKSNILFLQIFYLCKLMLSYLFEDYEQAFADAVMTEKHVDTHKVQLTFPLSLFYDSLARLAVYGSRSKDEQKDIRERVSANQKKMANWAGHGPSNFLHKFHLVEAERLRIQSQDMESVVDHYDKAITLANKNEYINEEALACELAAKYFLGKGNREFARLYIGKARQKYAIWGAGRKVRHLDETYPQLLSESYPGKTVPKNGEIGPGGLDWSTMMKLTQVISSQIELENLLPTLIRIAIENVGAQKGWLILDSDQGWQIVAGGTADQGEIPLSSPTSVEESDMVSAFVVTYVARTGKNLVVDNASGEEMFKKDIYIKTNRSKSILCAPIFHKSTLMGVLYLENNLMTGAFTTERLEVLRVLSAQIAISLENAKLYGNLKQAEEDYRGIFENATEGIYRTTPEGRFISANPAMAGIFGFQSPDELRESITDIEHQLYVDPERRNQFIEMMGKQQTVSGFEVEFYRKDRSTFWASLHARPVYDENQELTYIEGIVTDITEQKKTLEALREREEYLRKENIRLRSNVKDRFRFGNIIGKSLVMQEVYELILQASATRAGVVVYGESGTGKELVAKAIHDLSDRKGKKFVPVNCRAIPEGLLESEFFGYKKGAFTGATSDKHGYLDIASGGTLFLDELGELDLNMQAKLLRAIEGNSYTPVGGSELKKPDVRIVAATNSNLKDYVKKGLLREDFFYRIHILPIYLPPLRERKEDIPLLVEFFIGNEETDKELPPFTPHILEVLMNYDWPGNVRELQNTLDRYLTFRKLDFLGDGLRKPTIPPGFPRDGRPVVSHASLQDIEKEHIARLLERNQWNRTRVASILKISRYTLLRKIKKYGLLMTES